MNVYIESNFVLELAFLQEQSSSCEEILRLAEGAHIRLVVPAYALIEPYDPDYCNLLALYQWRHRS